MSGVTQVKEPSRAELESALEDERRARELAAVEVANLRRFAQALDRLSGALIGSQSLGQLLRRLLEIFLELVGCDVAVIRLRDGDRLRSRAAVGLEDEVAAGFSLPMHDALAGVMMTPRMPALVSSAAPDARCRGEFIRGKGVKTLHCVPLLDGEELLGVVYMGAYEDRPLSDEERHLLTVLASRAAAIVARHVAQEALQQAIRSRDEVLAVVAHDLRNPLNVIAMAANSLMQRFPDSTARRPVERILRGVERADRLIRDLLDVDAIERGRLSLEKRLVDSSEVILTAIESQQSLAAASSVILASDLSPDLPPIEADEERILEVLENLIGNAVKFTNAGGTVTVGASTRDDETLVFVQDSGSGIRPEQLPHLFDRFWQATQRDKRGSGLGLTICKGIVEAHGGRIWAESEIGVGTRVSFTIPSSRPSLVPPDPNAVSTILLVDDRPENLLALRAILDRPDYRLVTASSGEEALGLALRDRFALALIDVAMPGMDGFEVAAHLKELERCRDIPILFITAYGDDPQEIHRAYSAGGADYLVKPLDAEIVRKKVAVFVSLSRRRQDGAAQRSQSHDGS